MSFGIRKTMVAGVALLGLVTGGISVAAAVPVNEKAPVTDLSKPLHDLVKNGQGLDSFRLEVAWRQDGAVIVAAVFGTGVGIWRNESQFALARRQVLSIAETLDKAGFGKMPDQFGEDLDKGQALQMNGRITLWLGDLTKRVTQLGDGEQSQALAGAAGEILDVCRAVADSGVKISSLSDGLRKLGSHELAPETLQIYTQRLDEHPAGSADVIGWMIHSNGRRFVVRERHRIGGYGTPMRYILTPVELDDLVKLLAESDPASFPKNAYAPDYTDFDLKVLNQGRNIQARRYLNVTPETHGEKQRRFDRVFAALDALHQKALKGGKPAPGAE